MSKNSTFPYGNPANTPIDWETGGANPAEGPLALDGVTIPSLRAMVARAIGCSVFFAVGNYLTQPGDVVDAGTTGVVVLVFLLSVQCVYHRRATRAAMRERHRRVAAAYRHRWRRMLGSEDRHPATTPG
jgi:hypothetical protein